jgi:hypothetical protein
VNAALFVPQPFRETFEHPQGWADADRKSLVVGVLGPFGLCFGVTTGFVAVVMLALSTGLYIPGGLASANSLNPAPVPGVLPDVSTPGSSVGQIPGASDQKHSVGAPTK